MKHRAYHLILGTYGSRVHGGERPTVDRRMNKPGDPFVQDDIDLNIVHVDRMGDETAVYFSKEQRLFLEDYLFELSEKQSWRCHEVACQFDHLHTLISFDGEGKSLRRFIKTQLTNQLNEFFGYRENWWAKSGAIKPVISDAYFHEVRKYIYDQKCER